MLLIALAFPVSVTTSALYANATEVSITQQTKAISGVVFDGGLNEPLIGANVVVKGTTNGTVTDPDGKFTLDANPNDIRSSVVLVSKHLKLKPPEAANGKIVLKEGSQALDEVVVVGYSVQRRST